MLKFHFGTCTEHDTLKLEKELEVIRYKYEELRNAYHKQGKQLCNIELFAKEIEAKLLIEEAKQSVTESNPTSVEIKPVYIPTPPQPKSFKGKK